MKQFFKFLFASCLGTILALGVLFFGFFMIGSVFSAKDTSVPKNSVLLVEFNNFVPEKTGNVEQNPYSFELQSSLGLQRIKDLIDHASGNDNIKGIVYKTSSNTPLGMVTSTEIKKAIEEFRDSTDKFVYTYADFFTHKSYLLASASDSIFMNPNGMLEMKGYGAMIPFFKEMMDKAGIEMNIFYAGNYKSATEPFRRNDISPANREQTREYLNENFDLYLDEVASSRGVSRENLLNLVNNMDLENLPEALENNLVDGTTYWFEFEDKLRDRLGLSDGKKIKYMDLDEYNSKVTIKRGSSKNRIAVVYAEGEVVYDSEDKAVISERKYHKIFDKIKRDEKVKAVVLRVNSPGGSAFSSDAIWGELEEIKAKGIPVVASFGDYAASGGYYIAAGADKIVSHPQTLTGSIGVFTLFPNFTNLMEDKLGIHFDTVKTSPHAVSFTPFYDLNEEEKSELTTFVDQMYSKFLSRVADGRGSSKDEIHEVAQGRVWTGASAYENGLVDELGNLEKAIEVAAEMADIAEDFKISEYPKIKKDIFEELMMELMKQQNASMVLSDFDKKLLDDYNKLRAVFKFREPMARLPFTLECK